MIKELPRPLELGQQQPISALVPDVRLEVSSHPAPAA
jgi:hypothetical protein